MPCTFTHSLSLSLSSPSSSVVACSTANHTTVKMFNTLCNMYIEKHVLRTEENMCTPDPKAAHRTTDEKRQNIQLTATSKQTLHRINLNRIYWSSISEATTVCVQSTRYKADLVRREKKKANVVVQLKTTNEARMK